MNIELKMPEEKRDIDSEIDWKIIDQLHNAVLNFSRNSMQAKKIMFAMLGVFVTFMLQVKNFSIIIKWFPIVIVIVCLFWAFDSHTYYYQEKLRAAIDARFRLLKKRYPNTNLNDELTLPDTRKSCGRFWRSLFNVSVAFYPAIILTIVIFWVLIDRGVIL